MDHSKSSYALRNTKRYIGLRSKVHETFGKAAAKALDVLATLDLDSKNAKC